MSGCDKMGSGRERRLLGFVAVGLCLKRLFEKPNNFFQQQIINDFVRVSCCGGLFCLGLTNAPCVCVLLVCDPWPSGMKD